MSPIAVDDLFPSTPLEKSSPAASGKGPALVIGSLATAQEGTYQALISDLEQTRLVDKQLLDRLVDGAATLTPSHYASVHVTLSPDEYNHLISNKSRLPLFSQIIQGLTPLGTLHILNNISSIAVALPTELVTAGFDILSTQSHHFIAQKPSTSISSIPIPTKVALKRKKKSDNTEAKKAIWAVSSNPPASTTIIDSDSLLTPEDRARPVPLCEPIDPSTAKRRKRACKGCSCGLKELEEEDMRTSKIVVVDASNEGLGTTLEVDQKTRLAEAAKQAPKATSSCGSCFLGDAFRCASCPYLGLPAFKPGEKVEIDFGMDDI